MKMTNKDWVNWGLSLVLFRSSREWAQKAEDYRTKRLEKAENEKMKLQKEVFELMDENRKDREHYHDIIDKNEEALREQFAKKLESFDATKFLPHIPYLKGLTFEPEKDREVFKYAQFRCNLSNLNLYPEGFYEKVVSQIKGSMKVIPPSLKDDFIHKYYCNDEDKVIVRMGSGSFPRIDAGIYQEQEQYELAKREKSTEMDKLIDDISR